MDGLEAELGPVHAQITAFAGRPALARELFGVGPLVAVVVWAFLGDARRFSSSAQAVRHTGLDVTVYSSDDKRTLVHLSHQGPPILRWALFEAGHQGSRRASPDHRYYADVAERIDANRVALSVAGRIPIAGLVDVSSPARGSCRSRPRAAPASAGRAVRRSPV